MNKIENNPYRVCGLLAGASLKDVNRAKRNLKLASIGKTISSDLDFNFFNSINRTGDALKEAFSEIDQSQGKLKHAFFWFSKGNSFDETAINYLQNGDKQKALEIWEKVTTNRVINSKNISSLNNIGTLKLLNDNSRILKEGIEAKFKLIESDSFEDFVHIVADETYTIDRNNEIQRLITYLLKELKNRFSDREVFNFFTGCSDTVQSFLSKKFTQEPLHNIEGRIERTKSKRKSDKGNAYKYGLKLYQDCKDDLALLKSILGINDLKYKMTADSLANEIMQCGIDYFNENQETEGIENFIESAQKLTKLADSVAVGKLTKDRAKDNLSTLTEMKNREIDNAIAVLSSIKYAYEEAISEIDSHLASIKMTMSYNQTIDYSKVDKMKANCLDWSKVVEVVSDAISNGDIKRIKECSNNGKVSEYKQLVDFLLGKLNSSHKRKLAYLRYWKIKTAFSGSSTKPSTTSGSSTKPSTTSGSSTKPSTTSGDDMIWFKIIGWGIAIIIILRACSEM